MSSHAGGQKLYAKKRKITTQWTSINFSQYNYIFSNFVINIHFNDLYNEI